MSVAGSCGPDNLQPRPTLTFMGDNNAITNNFNGPGASCKGTIATGNNWPEYLLCLVMVPYIPINTPLRTATASDPDGDPITVLLGSRKTEFFGILEQRRNKGANPFIQIKIPNTTGSRTFPDMAVILATYPVNPPPLQGGLKRWGATVNHKNNSVWPLPSGITGGD